jgi:hypothetical protein
MSPPPLKYRPLRSNEAERCVSSGDAGLDDDSVLLTPLPAWPAFDFLVH